MLESSRLVSNFLCRWPWTSDPSPPLGWEYRCVPPRLVYATLGIKPKASCVLGKHWTSWAMPSASAWVSLILYVNGKPGFLQDPCSPYAHLRVKFCHHCSREYSMGMAWLCFPFDSCAPAPVLDYCFRAKPVETRLDIHGQGLEEENILFLLDFRMKRKMKLNQGQ